MRKKINVVTGNHGKVQLLQEHVSALGYEAVQVNLPIVEPQANSIEEVALSKATQAFQLLREPLVVEDSGFYINELSGFPGPFTRYVLDTIGVNGLLRLAEPLVARTCSFYSVLAYMDAAGNVHTFVDAIGSGILAREIDDTPCEDAWSDLWRVFIPVGYSKTLVAFSGDERAALWQKWRQTSVYTQFAAWLAAEIKATP